MAAFDVGGSVSGLTAVMAVAVFFMKYAVSQRVQ